MKINFKCLLGFHKYGIFGENKVNYFLQCHNCKKNIIVLRENINSIKLYGGIKQPNKLKIKLVRFLKKNKIYYKYKLWRFL